MTTEKTEREIMVSGIWKNMLVAGENPTEKRNRKLFKLLPGKTKCKWCKVPFDGPAAPVVKLVFGKQPGELNPKFCNACETFAREYQGGAEVEMSMLFADIRGSTTLAEGMSPSTFSQLIDRFYQATTQVLTQTDAIIDKLSGDEVAGFYVPGLAGGNFPLRAIQAAQDMLRATGHQNPSGPWVPVGIGIHTGVAFCGAVGTSKNVVDITALGDSVNIAARIASKAGVGEVLVSQYTLESAKLELPQLETRLLELKGKSEKIAVYVLKADTKIT
ncbi:MAG: adenylate/guanylate cyclase domain-containing protein [Anaerolineae bacterium]|nr:adenylate/guanylate cyclase domain-containing protein [Anaerolineae bacterium]